MILTFKKKASVSSGHKPAATITWPAIVLEPRNSIGERACSATTVANVTAVTKAKTQILAAARCPMWACYE
jgi:hypothetical protein